MAQGEFSYARVTGQQARSEDIPKSPNPTILLRLEVIS